jgi:hypothetical protein
VQDFWLNRDDLSARALAQVSREFSGKSTQNKTFCRVSDNCNIPDCGTV